MTAMTHSSVQQPHTSRDTTRNARLLDAVIRGDEEDVQRLLGAHADVNVTDATGRSAIACAITGENWSTADASDASFMTPGRLNVIRLLVEHPHISLYSLNAPQEAMNGATPLGVATWMNALEVVRILIETSAGAVSVNGMDGHGATALMYAARDGTVELVKFLLSNGARPDYRDSNNHTSIQYCLKHAQALWLCEDALRRLRTREAQSDNRRKLSSSALADVDALLLDDAHLSDMHTYPPPHLFTRSDILEARKNIINAIISADLPVLRSLLFPPPLPSSDASQSSLATPAPVLVNHPDAQDWSPIHYCVSVRLPSVDVLDTLYRAGADVSLFSKTGSCTPLHCLARKKRGPDSFRSPAMTRLLYQFVVHIVCDLKAPLAALDPNGETCIHIAAEHGDSAEVLRALLDCDTDGSVRDVRNSRGLTAVEVSRSEFHALFGTHDGSLRSSSSASLRTVRPLHSYSSVPSICSFVTDSPIVRPHFPLSYSSPLPLSLANAEDETLSSTADRILRDLRFISSELCQPSHTLVADIANLDSILRKTAARSRDLLGRWRTKVNEARDGLHGAQDTWAKIDSLLDTVSQAVEDKAVKEREERDKIWALEPHGRSRSGTTVSGDSQLTAVSDGNIEDAGSDIDRFVDSTDAAYGGLAWPPTFDADASSIHNGRFVSDAASTRGLGHMRLKSYKSTGDLHRTSPPLLQRSSPTRELARRSRADTLVGVVRNESGDGDSGSGSGKGKDGVQTQTQKGGTSSRFKAWFKRKILSDRTAEKPLPAVPRTSTEPRTSLTTLCEKDESAEKESSSPPSEEEQRVSYRALAAAGKDLARIDECISNTDKFIASAYRCIVQTEQSITKAIKTREALIYDHRFANTVDAGIEAVFSWRASDAPSGDVVINPIDIALPLSAALSVSVNSSAGSSVASLSSTLDAEESDEEDTRALQHLLKRKIAGKVDLALEEVEKVEVWLKVVKSVVRGVQRRVDVALQ